MEQATDAEKSMAVSEFLDFKRRNKVQFNFTACKLRYFIWVTMVFYFQLEFFDYYGIC